MRDLLQRYLEEHRRLLTVLLFVRQPMHSTILNYPANAVRVEVLKLQTLSDSLMSKRSTQFLKAMLSTLHTAALAI